jgi:lipopolysaccharide/colanic/teichoic acid biosynthesis glycosyltransferase
MRSATADCLSKSLTYYFGSRDRMNQHTFSSGRTDAASAEGPFIYGTALASRSVLDSDYLIWPVQAFVSLLGLLLVSPLILLIAVAVKVADGGPVLYKGQRVGRGGRIFHIYKFRTLVEDAEKKIGARLLNQDDQGAYYTPIGRWLKRSKLDELPQLFNVIRGNMRFAGPRPVRPIFLEQFKDTIAGYELRFLVPPGITGIAQLRGGYYTSPRNKLRYDLIYIKHRSLVFDFQLVFLTLVKICDRWFSTGFFILFLFLFVSFIPAEVQLSLHVSVAGLKISLVYLFIILIACGLFLKNGPRQVALYRGPLNLPLVLFVAVSVISAILSQNVDHALQRAGYYIVTGFMVAFMIVNNLATKGFILMMTRVVALTSVLMSVLGLFQIFLSNYTVALASSAHGDHLVLGYVRASALLGNPVVLAVYLVLGLPLLFAEVILASSQRKRDFWLICATLSFVGIFFTQTRIGLLALFVTGTAFLSRRLTHSLSFVTVCLLCVLFLISLGGARFSPSGFQEEVNDWAEEKTNILQTIPLRTWLIGGGAITPFSLVTDPEETEPEPRKSDEIPNMNVTLALEHGIAGWCIIIWIILSALWAMKQAHKRTKDPQLKTTLWAIISSLIGFLISMNSMNVFHNLTLQIYFWSLVGIGLGIVVHLNGQRRCNLIWRFGDAGDS